MVSLCCVILRRGLGEERPAWGRTVPLFLAAVALVTAFSLTGLCHPLAAALDLSVALGLLAGELR